MSYHYRIYIFTILLVIANSCANQRPPTGGEKDETPPELVSSNPENRSLNFNGTEIELTFNELVQLKEAKEQLIITPTVSDEYEIKFKKDKVLIELAEPLDSSTTYTFSFRNAIQDLNEGNPAEDLKIAFSTGSYLDSLSIGGTVFNTLKDKPVEDFTVSLYETKDTLNPLEHPPLYFTKTDKTGQYLFENLKSSNYHIIAFNDKNKNLILDSKSESFGFISDTLHLTENIDSLRINTQQLDIRPLEFLGARQSGTTYVLRFNKHLVDYNLYNPDSIQLKSNFTDNTHSSIQVFNTFTINDSLLTIVKATDSLKQQVTDTTNIKFEETSRSPSELISNLELDNITEKTRLLEARLSFNKPIKTIKYDSIYIYLDPTNIIKLDSSDIKSTNNTRDEIIFTYTFDKSLFEADEVQKQDSSPTQSNRQTNGNTKKLMSKDSLESKNNQNLKDSTKTTTSDSTKTEETKKEPPHIYFAKNSFITVENDSSKIIKQELTFKTAESMAMILFKAKTEADSYLVQLLNKDGELVEEAINQPEGSFTSLTPGDYQLRLVIDSNNNQKWDPGNYIKLEQPESIYFYRNRDNETLINLRANWEVGPLTVSD